MHDSKKPTLLVTGALGFVGSRLVRALTEQYGPESVIAMVHSQPSERDRSRIVELQGLNVTILPADLLQPISLIAPDVDVVFHLAAHTDIEHRSECVRVNDVGTQNLLDWIGPKLRGKRVVFTGTLASVDRSCPRGWLDESTLCTPQTEYGKTKYEGEKRIMSGRSFFGYAYTIVRLGSVVGPNYRPDGMFGIFPDMLARRALATRLNWPGRSAFIHVDDAVKILMSLADNSASKNELYVVSNGEPLSFDILLDDIAELFQLPRQKFVLPTWIWSAIGYSAWLLLKFPVTPYRIRLLSWRIGHMIWDGMYADASKLNALLGMNYRSVRRCIQDAYGKPATTD